MKKLTSLIILSGIVLAVKAQKVDYKDNTIIVDGNDVATVFKIKGPMGLANTYKILSMKGDTLISAIYDDKAEENKNNNMSYYYTLTFKTVNMVGIFGVSKLGTEKSIAKLIGKGNIIVNDKMDADKVAAFIKKEGKMPVNRVDYTIVSRDRGWPSDIKDDKTIEQNSKTIGRFENVSSDGSGTSTYNFYLANGSLIATISFDDNGSNPWGNNAEKFNVNTMKDNNTRTVTIKNTDKVGKILSKDVDNNYHALKRVVKWLIDNQYM